MIKFIGYATWDADNQRIKYGPQHKLPDWGVWHKVFEQQHDLESGTFTMVPKLYVDGDESIILYEVVAQDILASTPAPRERINAMRADIEAKPVRVGDVLVDIDPVSEQRMVDIITLWDNISLTDVEWTLADNSSAFFSKEEFMSLLHGAKVERAKRSIRLHAVANAMKKSGSTTLRDLLDWSEEELSMGDKPEN